MYHLVLAVVKAETVPCGMFMSVAGIEILVGVASQIAQSFHLVLHGMTVHNVHDDRYALLVSLIDELLEFFGSAEAR